MKTYVQPGNTITLTAPYASPPAMVCSSARSSACLRHCRPRETVEAALVGVYELKKLGSQAWASANRIYWDNTARQTTKVTTSNTLIGVATEVVAGGAGDVSAGCG